MEYYSMFDSLIAWVISVEWKLLIITKLCDVLVNLYIVTASMNFSYCVLSSTKQPASVQEQIHHEVCVIFPTWHCVLMMEVEAFLKLKWNLVIITTQK